MDNSITLSNSSTSTTSSASLPISRPYHKIRSETRKLIIDNLNSKEKPVIGAQIFRVKVRTIRSIYRSFCSGFSGRVEKVLPLYSQATVIPARAPKATF
jgi:hypothetical protein